ncbi:1,4-alpha-glucan branching protein [Intrasporangium oryzae NRRL B-24470]|uniref:1,4-alpha-glucan branching enzyme n=1 Tax=Intrasporangium oryzae NRRL B-24470 TaxID=1386089 RepID=W9G6L4_9MICO|nr:alpha-amylase family glycosyl hydrolase [Intrasporangium oryzae]EWT00947.1 1,4-alpha-glucan branching protein [Intrasporangium oryzae NRRL B-24470]
MSEHVHHRPGLGAIPHEGGTAFRVWAPHADGVAVIGGFNGWSGDRHPMVREDGGHWYADVEGVRHGDEYQFLIRNGDTHLHRIDPRARAVTNSVGNGIVYDRGAFDWHGDAFVLPPHHELVIYETHIGSFVSENGDRGHLGGLLGKLGYLRELGINAVELMPVAEFAGDYSWGYNPADPFAVESGYGGPDLLKTFVREAHKSGIAVIVDVVYNHFGPSDLALWQFDGWSENDKGGIYFYNDDRASTPWGDTRPDYGRPEVREYIHDNALMWVEEFHVDGLRFDATLYIRTIDGPGTDLPEGWELMRSLTSTIHERHPGTILIAEDLQGDPAITTAEDGGAGFDAQWDSGFVRSIRDMLSAVDDGERSMGALAEALVGHEDPLSRIVYTESHDEVANGKLRVPHEIDGDDPSGWHAQKRATLGMAIALTAPGIPMLFQGQEFLEDEWFRDTVPLDWERAEAFRDIVRLTRDLILLRRNLGGDSAGLTGHGCTVLHLDDEAKTLAWSRWNEEAVAVVVVNASAEPREVTTGIPAAGDWRLRFNSDAGTYSALFGDHPSADVEAVDEPLGDQPAQGTVSVGPYSLVVLTPA